MPKWVARLLCRWDGHIVEDYISTTYGPIKLCLRCNFTWVPGFEAESPRVMILGPNHTVVLDEGYWNSIK